MFYIEAGIGIVWCVIFMALTSDEPKDCKWISKTELDYIETSLNSTKQEEKVIYFSNISLRMR